MEDNKKKVLIVDDAMFMRNVISNILTEEGFVIVGEADNGLQAVKMYKENLPDLVTMDITMTEMDGISALKEIISYNAEAKVIMCSAMVQKAFIDKALEAGAKDFLVKPFAKEQVLDSVRRVLGINKKADS